MGEIKSHVVSNATLFMGDNFFQQENVRLAAGKKYQRGLLLYRSSFILVPVTSFGSKRIDVSDDQDGSVMVDIPQTTEEQPMAILAEELDNSAGLAEKTFPTRVLISGRVRSDMLYIDAEVNNKMNPYRQDVLRQTGIIPINVTDISRQDN
jgi:hypothetical protein